MAEQQLVDYIKKARDAGQADDQSRALLTKNGWTDAEINDAVASLAQPAAQPMQQPDMLPQMAKPAAQPQMQPQPQPQAQPQPAAAAAVAQPQMQPQAQPQMAQSGMPRMRGRSHIFLKILTVIIILGVLGGAGYYVAAQYFNFSLSDLFAPDPMAVVTKMLANMQNVKSSHFVINVSANGTDLSKAPQGGVAASITGESDVTDIKNPKADAAISLSLTPTPPATGTGTANVNIVVVNNTLYLRLNDTNFPLPLSMLYPGLDISQIKGKYFQIDANSFAALSQANPQALSALPISFSNVPTQVDTSALQKKLQDLITAENLLSVSKQLGSETVSGQDTYHYLVTIPAAKLKDLSGKILAMAETEMQTATAANSGVTLSPLVQNMAQAFVNTFIDAVGDINMNVWIGKKDYMLYRATLDQTIDLSKIVPTTKILVDVKFDIVNSNFNKPIAVQAPAGAQKIEDFVLPLLKNQKAAADFNQIGSLAHSSFAANSTYSSLCSRGLLNGYLKTYGTQLVAMHTDIVSQGAKKPVCFSSATDYCVSAQLADGSFMCIDKNMTIGKTQCVSATTACQ